MTEKLNTEIAFDELRRGVYAALETYSNVHRGSGHNSLVTTHLFERAREIVLDHLGLNSKRHVVIFCTPRRSEILKLKLKIEDYKFLTSKELGLPLGVVAVAADKGALPAGVPFQAGGGTTRLISRDWVIWADAPDRFEAGTPAIINIIAFAKALLLIRHNGIQDFREKNAKVFSSEEILYHDELEDFSGKLLLEKLRQTHIGRNVFVPTLEGEKIFINLDNAASTPTFTPVWDAFCEALRQPENIRKEIISSVRQICSDYLGAPPKQYDIIFTSNTTESINLVAESLGREVLNDGDPVILNTLLEHNSNELPWRLLPNFSQMRLDVNAEGFLDLNVLDSVLKDHNQERKFGNKHIKLVAVSGASNVLGTFNDLEDISRIVHKHGASLIVDGAQLVAHRKVEMEKWGIDYLAFSGHKAYAPFGSGALVARRGLLRFGSGELEQIKSSGEENAAGIAALGKAIVLLQRVGMEVIVEEEQALTRQALDGMAQMPGMTVYGIKDPLSKGFERKGGVIVFSLKNMMGNAIAKKLASQGGIGIRYGCHCSHLIVKHILNVGPGLEKFQHLMLNLLPKMQLPGVARVSIGIENTEKNIEELIRVLELIASGKKYSKDIKAGTKKADFKLRMRDFVKDAETRVYSNSARVTDAR